MAKITKIYIFTIAFILFISASLFYFLQFSSEHKKLPPYFSYSEAELEPLLNEQSNLEITVTDLYKWDSEMFSLIKKYKFGDAPASRVFAYLYTAQRDFGFISHNIKHKFMGNIDNVTAKALCLFFSE